MQIASMLKEGKSLGKPVFEMFSIITKKVAKSNYHLGVTHSDLLELPVMVLVGYK